MNKKEKEEVERSKGCMFKEVQCTSYCRGWDYENKDCRMLGMLWKITEVINYKKDEGVLRIFD